MIPLTEKVERLHDSLDQSHVPHAFGGALALAYCIAEPRATADIDVNVFVAPSRAAEVFEAMPAGVTTTSQHLHRAIDSGQVRLDWDDTPVDLFFASHRFHADAAARTRTVPFASTTIPILDCADVAVFKAIFGRPQDWVDISRMVESGGIDLDVPLSRLEALVGAEHSAYTRLASLTGGANDEGEAYRRVFRPDLPT